MRLAFVVLLFIACMFFIGFYLLQDVTDKSSLRMNEPSDRRLSSINDRPYDVSYVSQASIGRFFYIPYLSKRWTGPMVVALYLKKEEWDQYIQMKEEMSLESRITIVLSLQKDPDLYPINKLRNIAISNSHTTHFFMSDMDMWPSYGMYDVLTSLPSYLLEDDHFAGIIPAFEIEKPVCNSLQECVSITRAEPRFPSTKPELIQCLKNNSCYLYREKKSTHNYLYEKWFHTDCPYHYSLVPCWFNAIQEPYVMVKKSKDLPQFDERFVNYGFNKITWLHHLIRRGYYFGVISRCFVMDMPHPESVLRQRYVNEWNSQGGSSMLSMYQVFMKELENEPNLTVVPICGIANKK